MSSTTDTKDPMADRSTSMPIGQISWTEIPVVDLARAQEFYKGVFGWDFTTMPSTCPETGKPSEAPKRALFSKGSCHGCLVSVEPDNHLSPALHPNNPEKKRLAVRVTITTESVDESLMAIENAGGAVYLPKQEIPNNMGYVAYFTDTENNVMGVWSMK